MSDTTSSPPSVTVVMAARDAASTIADAVTAALAQDYAGPLDMVVAVGPSADDTRAVVDAIAADDSRLTVVDNSAGITPAGLNRAIASASGRVIVRCDAHAVLPRDYVATAVATMAETGAANVGGIQAAEGTTTFERAAALAMTSRFGVGDAQFHYGGDAGPVDTVYLGVFDRAALDTVGGYDEAMVRNQDYELNHRLRQSNHTVWFTPELRVRYRPRGSLAALARQYHEYGRWKRVMLRRNPEATRLRQLAPPLLVVGLLASALLTFTPLWWMAWWLPAIYGSFLVIATIVALRRAPGVPALMQGPVLATMHVAWGAGFIRGIGMR